MGHVSWSARELMLLSLTIISISFADRSSAVRLYFSSLGEQWNILFWPAFFIVMLVKHFAATAETWSLGYWSQQYETQPASEVNVPRYVVFCLHYTRRLKSIKIPFSKLSLPIYYFGGGCSGVFHRIESPIHPWVSSWVEVHSPPPSQFDLRGNIPVVRCNSHL